MHWEDRFRELSAHQDGVIGIDQVPDIGCRYDHWRRAKASPRWTPLSRRVLQLRGAPPTERQRVIAALLDAGG